MLSIDISSQLKASGTSFDDEKLALPETETEVDLLSKPTLELDHQTPLSKFSLRDYVFTARNKDIKTNWPFSQRSLQLCLEHGVKDILPPLLPSRKQALNICDIGKSVKENGNISNLTDRSSDGISNHLPLDFHADNAQLNQEDLAVVDSCKSSGENDFPSATTSVCHSEIESVPTNRQSSPPWESLSLLGASVDGEPEEVDPLPYRRSESTTCASSKKCRLIVKVGSRPVRESAEDIDSNHTAVLDIMASKVCPVCKNFSSSSNTTLNAHIDQCLSGESTPKWTVSSKVLRHKIKPRKIRLMTDIYATSQPCTLEDLDRRNGSDWATVSTIPAEGTETLEGKNRAVSLLHPENTRSVNDVYVDASGTKLRILSRSNNVSASKAVEDAGPSKQLTRREGNGSIPTKKKRQDAQNYKHNKYLKIAFRSKKVRSHISRHSQVSEDEEEVSGAGRSLPRGDENKISKLPQLSEPGTLQKWVGSKRTGLVKKVHKRSGLEPMRCKLHVAQEFHAEDKQSKLSKNPVSAENVKPTLHRLNETEASGRKEQSSGTKRIRSSMRSNGMDGDGRSLPLSKRNCGQFSECSPTCDSHLLKSPTSTRNGVTSVENRITKSHAGHCGNLDVSPGDRAKAMKNYPAMVVKITGNSTFRKRFSSKSQSVLIKSKSNTIEKRAAFKKSKVSMLAEKDVVERKANADVQNNSLDSHPENQSGQEETIGRVSIDTNKVMEIKKEHIVCISSREKDIDLKSQVRGGCHDGSREMISSVCIDDDSLSKFNDSKSDRNEPRPLGYHIASELLSQASVVQNDMSCNEALNCESHRLKTQSNSTRSRGNYEGLLCEVEAPSERAEFRLAEGGTFCADDVAGGIRGPYTRVKEEHKCEIGFGHTYPEVDPILIPGPPGSFLPSPRAMDSEDHEDFQGNSSMTTSRAQSSQGQHDMVEKYLSDSPLSATSTISNSMMGGSEAKHADITKSAGSAATGDRVMSSFSCGTTEFLSGNSAQPPCATSTGTEKMISVGEHKFLRNYDEREYLGYKDDVQPCCCRRKERVLQNLSLKCDESDLLRRRAMSSSLEVPFLGNQLGYSVDTKTKDLEEASEMLMMRNCPSSVSEKVFLPAIKPLVTGDPFRGSSDAELKLIGCGDSGSASRSGSSSSVLRLMGKNLMVVKKEEDALMSPAEAEPCFQNDPFTLGCSKSTRVPPSNVPSEACVSSQDPSSTLKQCFDIRMSSDFKSQGRKQETLGQLSIGLFNSQLTHGFPASSHPYQYHEECSVPTQDFQHKRITNAESASFINSASAKSDCQYKKADSIVESAKEIIIINDGHESEADLANDFVRKRVSSRHCQVVSSGISIPPTYYSVMQAGTFPCCYSPDSSVLSDSPTVNKSSCQVTSAKQVSSPVKFSGTSGGFALFQGSPFMVPPSSIDHQRSALYYPSRLS